MIINNLINADMVTVMPYLQSLFLVTIKEKFEEGAWKIFVDRGALKLFTRWMKELRRLGKFELLEVYLDVLWVMHNFRFSNINEMAGMLVLIAFHQSIISK